MLFKFKSQATSDLIMLEADARRLLKIMLRDDPIKGIVQAKDLPSAIAALESAMAKDESDRKLRADKSPALVIGEDDDPVPLNSVSLAQRAAPMLKLLKRCLAENADVVWGI